jgi:hypothetical protein
VTGIASLPWAGMVALGAWHGINPAMGWLFAVALGVQEESGRAVWRALGPLALGHALAVGAAVLFAVVIGSVVPRLFLQWFVAAVLVGFGVYRLVRRRHVHWVGMRVGPKDLALWSALMALAHGAGLMVLPFVLGAAAPVGLHATHGIPLAPGSVIAVWATVVHAAAYLLVTGTIAVIVYEKLGLRLLRSAWLNVDVIWASALIVTGVLTPLL